MLLSVSLWLWYGPGALGLGNDSGRPPSAWWRRSEEHLRNCVMSSRGFSAVRGETSCLPGHWPPSQSWITECDVEGFFMQNCIRLSNRTGIQFFLSFFFPLEDWVFLRASLHYFLVAFYLTVLLTRNGPWPASLPLYLWDACNQSMEEARCIWSRASALCCSQESWPQISFYVAPSFTCIREIEMVCSHCILWRPNLFSPLRPLLPLLPILLCVHSTLLFQSWSGNCLAAVLSFPL